MDSSLVEVAGNLRSLKPRDVASEEETEDDETEAANSNSDDVEPPMLQQTGQSVIEEAKKDGGKFVDMSLGNDWKECDIKFDVDPDQIVKSLVECTERLKKE